MLWCPDAACPSGSAPGHLPSSGLASSVGLEASAVSDACRMTRAGVRALTTIDLHLSPGMGPATITAAALQERLGVRKDIGPPLQTGQAVLADRGPS
jgi:hypothetical protein